MKIAKHTHTFSTQTLLSALCKGSLLCLLLACGMLAPRAAHAQAAWTNSTSGVWSSANNWDLGFVPGAGNNTEFRVRYASSIPVVADVDIPAVVANMGRVQLGGNRPIKLTCALGTVTHFDGFQKIPPPFSYNNPTNKLCEVAFNIKVGNGTSISPYYIVGDKTGILISGNIDLNNKYVALSGSDSTSLTTISGNITNNGTISLDSFRQATLTGTNSYTGVTILRNASYLTGSSRSITGVVTQQQNTSALIIEQNFNGNLNARMRGKNGPILKRGNGLVTLTTSGNEFPTLTHERGTFRFTRSDQFSTNITPKTTVLMTNGAPISFASNCVIGANLILSPLAANVRSLSLDVPTSSQGTWNGTFSVTNNPVVRKVGGGTLIRTAALSDKISPVIEAGTLEVNTTSTSGGTGKGNLLIASAGTLAGTGIISPGSGNSITNRGTISPGANSGLADGNLRFTLSGGEKVVFKTGSNLKLTLGTTNTDLLKFSSPGNWLTIEDGANLVIEPGPGFVVGTFYTIATNIDTAPNRNFVVSGTATFQLTGRSYRVRIDGLPTPSVITSATNIDTYVGDFDFAYTITATPTVSTTYGAIGLPAWATLNPSTGAITGLPDTAATNYVTLTATNIAGGSSKLLRIGVSGTVPPGPTAFTPGDLDNNGTGDLFTIKANTLWVLRFQNTNCLGSNAVVLPAGPPASKPFFVARTSTNNGVYYKQGKISYLQLFKADSSLAFVGSPIFITNAITKKYGKVIALGDFSRDGVLDLLTRGKNSGLYIIRGPDFTRVAGPLTKAQQPLPSLSGKYKATVAGSNSFLVYRKKSILTNIVAKVAGTNILLFAGPSAPTTLASGNVLAYSKLTTNKTYNTIFNKTGNLYLDTTQQKKGNQFYTLPKPLGKILGPK